MSDLAILIPGPIQQVCWSSAGEFDAMVSGSVLKPTFGLTVRSATAPDVITYPAFKNFTWEDISTTPLVVRYWNAAMSSWDAQAPAAGSIVNSMIADHTILPVKFSVSGGSPGNIYRINSGGTDVIWDDPQNLYTTTPLQVANLSKSGVGSYVLVDNGVAAPSWALVSSIFTGGIVPITSIATTGAVSPQVLAYSGTTLGYQYVEDVIRPLKLSLGLVTPGPANNIPIVDSTGSVVAWNTPAQLTALLLPYVQSNYVTPTASLQAIPAAATSAQFAHGLGATPTSAGGFLICVTADGAFAVGDKIPWDNTYETPGGINRYNSTMCDGTYVYLTNVVLDTGLWLEGKTGTATHITYANWKVGAWANK